MLPRVTKALSHFIAPIASSFSGAKPAGDQSGAVPGFVRQDRSNLPKNNQQQQKQPQKQPQQEPQQAEVNQRPELKLVVDSETSPLAQEDPAPKLPTGVNPQQGPSLTDSFVQMCNRFQNQRTAALKWLGALSYKRVAKDQRRTSRFRKGSVLDDKAS